MKDEEIRQIIQRIKDNPELAKELYYFLIQYFAEKSDLNQALEALKRLEEQNERRFEALLNAMNERFEESNRRFEALQREMNERFAKIEERFAKVDERFAELHREMNERFAKVDERFAELHREMNERFNYTNRGLQRLENMMVELHSYMGGNLEGLVWTFMHRELRARGYQQFVLKRNCRIHVPRGAVHEDTTEVELDMFCSNPLVVVEVTGILRSLEKVDSFIQKVKFIRQAYQGVPEGLIALIATDVADTIQEEVQRRLQMVNAELITRQEILERLARLPP